MRKILFFLTLALTVVSASCKKPAGEGGNSSLTGKVWGQKWNNSFTSMSSEGPAVDQNVFIIYGNDTNYGAKTATGPDGSFKFPYLRKGKYRIYSYSKAAVTAGNPNGKVEVYVDAEITKKKQTVDVGQLKVNI